MNKTVRVSVSFFLLGVVFCGGVFRASACGPFTLSPVFSLKTHGDFPLSEYAGGKTGVVPDSFWNASLFVFYRQINNLPLSAAEQKQVVEAMENQIFYRSGRYDPYRANERVPDHFGDWQAARVKVTNEKRDVETEKLVAGEYYRFRNCLPAAFQTAALTLEARLARYGSDEFVREWLKGQDAVFSNCGGTGSLPAAPAENFPEWLRRDRLYQIAAAKFYAGDFPGAREIFETVGADVNSEWYRAAKFVAARTYIREASFTGGAADDQTDEAAKTRAEAKRKELLDKASEKLQNILADAAMNEFHPSAHRLLGLVKYRAMPDERRRELADLLVQKTENSNIYNDLIDFDWLLDFQLRQAYDKGSAIDAQEAEKAGRQYDYDYRLKLRDLPADRRTQELTDWIFTYKAVDGFEHAFEKWRETRRLHWFVAALIKTDAKSAAAPEMLREADQVSPDSAAFATVRFHQIRLLAESGKRAEAKRKLDEFISGNLAKMPLSSQNKFLQFRMTFAENLEDFLKYAPRRAATFVWSDTSREELTSLKDDERLKDWENRSMFDTDAVAFLNEQMPLASLRQAALSPKLPPHLRRFLIIAVWTRAFMLGNQSIEREFTALMQRDAKEFSPHFSKYAAASGAADREAAGLIAVLRYPVLQPFVPVGYGREDSSPTEIDSNRGNWWCAEEKYPESRRRYDFYPFEYPAVYPDFLTAAETASATRERNKLKEIGNSATALARRAVDFALKNPNHSQVPEILHLAVRGTRYGCTDEATGKFSKQAFDILHKRYPKSPWTKETPYWFS